MRRARTSFALASLATVAILGAAPARAEDAKAALVHFQKGAALFKIDRFKEALAEYQAAYVDKPDASFLFNIAQCHRKLGSRQDAIRFYRKYLIEFRLDRGRDAPNAKAVQGFIAELEAGIAAAAQPPPAAPPPPVAAPTPAAPVPPPPAVPPPVAQAPIEPAPAPTPSFRNEISPPVAPPVEPAPNPFLPIQPPPTQWESAPQSPGQAAVDVGAGSAAGSPVAGAAAASGAGADRYAASPTGLFAAQAAVGYATWKEDVSSRISDDRGNYDTRANGPTLGLGIGLGVGYSRFFALADFGYRYFNAGKRGGFLPSTSMNSFQAGGRTGLRSDHVDVWARLGWAMTAIAIPNTDDDLPSEKLAGFAGGGGIDVKDVTARHLAFSARADIGLSGERSQEKASGRDLSEGESQTTKWSEWSVSAGMPFGAGLDLYGALGLRLVDTTFEGFSERLAAADPGTTRSTTVISLAVGLAYRR